MSLIFISKNKSKRINQNNDNKIINNKKPKIIAITYSNKYYQRQLQFNKKTALEIGKVDEHYSFGPNDIDKDFREKNKEILSRHRGNGYWLWKPYFMLKTLKEKLKEGDYLIYTDATILYMNSTYVLIDFLKEQKAEMWIYRIPFIEKHYTKRDAFVLLGVDKPFYTDTYQYLAGMEIYKKSNHTEKFLEQFLYYAQDKRIITDDPNTQGLNNYPGFRGHRHDQSILSLLIKKNGEVNAGNSSLSLDELSKRKQIKMPNIFCVYRRAIFKDYDDLYKQCINKTKAQCKAYV